MLIKSRMHPKNIYKNPPDYKELAIAYPEFRKFIRTDLSGKVTIDYQDQKAVKELTRTLLKKDFDLEVLIDDTRLIPRVPLSLNYILWIEDLLNILQLQTQVLGIDIGTGCVCIYSLLGAKKGWKMLATELDIDNFKLAEKNVIHNNFTDLISLKLVSKPNKLLLGVINESTIYDFCMCNPPFFHQNEKPQNRTLRRKQLETLASEVSTEISTEGGESAFISKLIKESEILKEKIKIFTTLVGKKDDFLYLKKEVYKVHPKSVAFTEFCQGRTVRWGLAWTFFDIDLRNGSKTEKPKKNKSKPLQFTLPGSKTNNLDLIFLDLKNILNDLKISFKEESLGAVHMLNFKACKNTWSHQRRKKRLQKRTNESGTSQNCKISDDEEKCSETQTLQIGSNESGMSQRRRITDDEETCSEAKRLKLDEEHNDDVESVLVEGTIILKSIESSIVLEFSWISGNKEALHQIFQYFKNYWSKDIISDP